MNLKLLSTIFFLFLFINKAESRNTELLTDYEGPQIESSDIKIIYTENAKTKATISASKAEQYKNKDTIYPNGIYVEFYDDEEQIKATLVADYVKYDAKEKIYIIRGHIKLYNKKKNETLETSELIWIPDEKKIISNRFVKINTEDVSLVGKGIDANEDLSRYKILEPHGSISIKKKSNNST